VEGIVNFGIEIVRNDDFVLTRFTNLDRLDQWLIEFPLHDMYSKWAQLQFPLLIVSYTLPNAFSYNSKMTFHLPSVFSPSPSLNPKAEI
jgi:hypothetical protein